MNLFTSVLYLLVDKPVDKLCLFNLCHKNSRYRKAFIFYGDAWCCPPVFTGFAGSFILLGLWEGKVSPLSSSWITSLCDSEPQNPKRGLKWQVTPGGLSLQKWTLQGSWPAYLGKGDQESRWEMSVWDFLMAGPFSRKREAAQCNDHPEPCLWDQQTWVLSTFMIFMILGTLLGVSQPPFLLS